MATADERLLTTLEEGAAVYATAGEAHRPDQIHSASHREVNVWGLGTVGDGGPRQLSVEAVPAGAQSATLQIFGYERYVRMGA